MFPIWERCTLCRVRVILKKTLKEFWLEHNDCEERLKAWHKEAEEAAWQTPQQIKVHYPSASFLADNRVMPNALASVKEIFWYPMNSLTL